MPRRVLGMCGIGAIAIAVFAFACTGEDPDSLPLTNPPNPVDAASADAGGGVAPSIAVLPERVTVHQKESVRVKVTRKGGTGSLRVVPVAPPGITVAAFDITTDAESIDVDLAVSEAAARGPREVLFKADDRTGATAEAKLTIDVIGPPGTPDETFGTLGVAEVPNIEILALTTQTDGRVVVAGIAGGQAAVARLSKDGTLDKTFGPAGSGTAILNEASSSAVDVAIDPSGRIVAALRVVDGGVAAAGLWVLKTDGNPDAAVGSMGLVKTPSIDGGVTKALRPTSMAIQPDGRIVVAGRRSDTNGSNAQFAVIRYTASGALDLTFGAVDPKGLVFLKVGGVLDSNESANSVAVRPDGKIVVVGFVAPSAGVREVAVLRLSVSGSPDPTFGAGTGIFKTASSGHENAVSALVDGTRDVAVTALLANGRVKVAMLRLLPTGAIEPWAGGLDRVVFDYDAGGASDPIRATTSASGYAYIAGATTIGPGPDNGAGLLTRIHLDGGVQDLAFGDNGWVLKNTPSANETFNAVAVATDGNIFAAGFGGSPAIGFVHKYNP